MQHSCRYPCFGCHWQKDSEEHSAELRTFESIRDNHAAWLASGGAQNNLKNFFNCKDEPLKLFPRTGIIVHHVPPPSLHLRLGLVNTLYTGLKNVFPGADEWPS